MEVHHERRKVIVAPAQHVDGVSESPGDIFYLAGIEKRGVRFNVGIEPYLVDIHVSADYLAVLVFDGYYFFDFLRTFVVQQRQSAIEAVGNGVPFQNVHTAFQVFSDSIEIKFRQRAFLRSSEIDMIEDFHQIVSR